MEQKKTGGYIYILTNPSFEEYVKIGFAKDVKQRLRQLNNTECTPFAFRVYATYQVDADLGDKKIHEIIDKLNPDLRSIDSVEGKERKREFYAMTPEDAYDILRAIAQLHGMEDRLKLVKPSQEEKKQEKMAEEIAMAHGERGAVFSFQKCGIPVGAELCFVKDSNIKCRVVDDRKIEYNGQTMYLTGLAKLLLNKKTGIAGPGYFTYNGTNLQRFYEKYQAGNKEN